MPKKYHVPVKTAEPRFAPIGRYATMEFREDCAGSCRQCVKKKCVYHVFREDDRHRRRMAAPEYLYACQSCFRCVQECTKGIFSRVINPEYRTLGDDYWQAHIIRRLWYQAHTGKIPVSGGGYGGPFVGDGVHAMWTDMSEIVRPTRDGIHGREYINTCIELSRRVSPLRFNADMTLATTVSSILEIPLPILLQLPRGLVVNLSLLEAAARAAQVLGTLLAVRPEDVGDRLRPYAAHLMPCLTADNYRQYLHQFPGVRAVSLAEAPAIEAVCGAIRKQAPQLKLVVRLPLDQRAAVRALELAHREEVDTLHFYADDLGQELHSDQPRFIKEMIREVHLKLVDAAVRKNINLIFSGGIAMAEHVAKAIICGADGVMIDHPVLIALECRLCRRCRDGRTCPVGLEKPINPRWGSQRIINLIGAWHNQLIEVMGAMGIREVRRLRGEVGRSMWFEDLEMESFAPIFGSRKVTRKV